MSSSVRRATTESKRHRRVLGRDPVPRGVSTGTPDPIGSRQLRTRLVLPAAVVALIVSVVWLAPGLDQVRNRVRHASPGWLVFASVLELLSALSYVLIFRSVFCPRMSWRMSYLIGVSEQAANSILPAGGAGGLALGAWALRRVGAPAGHIARRTVAFFLLTSFANVVTLILFALGFVLGILDGDRAPAVTFGFAGAGVVAIAVTLAGPGVTTHVFIGDDHSNAGRVRASIRHAVSAVGAGARDATCLLRQLRVGVIAGSFGYMAFDIAVLGVCFQAFGRFPALGVLVVAYLIGQLGGLLPIPGGIGGIEGGLIGAFALYHVPLASATAAVLVFRGLAFWIPVLLGTNAFLRLRDTLRQEPRAGLICEAAAGSTGLPHASIAAS